MGVRRAWRIVAASLLALSLVMPANLAFAGAPGAPAASTVAVIVRAKDGTSATAACTVRAAGGRVTRDLSIIGGVAADVPASAVGLLSWNGSIRSVACDAPVKHTWGGGWSSGGWSSGGARSAPTPGPANTYPDTTRVKSVWDLHDSRHDNVEGEGVGIAIVDSGIASDADLQNVSVRRSFGAAGTSTDDTFGHGTTVAGIAAGTGNTDPSMKGMASHADLYSLKVSDAKGNATESDVVAALQWILENKAAYNIRVVNLSVNCDAQQPYDASGLDAACEILWFNKIVVVVSAGNNGGGHGNTIDASPANDPFVITVGASDEKGTASTSDDVIAPWSSAGKTSAGFSKPDVVAPGTGIWSVLSSSSAWKAQYPARVSPNGKYFKISGTSMSAPMVAGTVALMLQKSPDLNPDQVKYRLTHSGRTLVSGGVAYPYLDAYSAVTQSSGAAANGGIQVSSLLTTGPNAVNSSVMWNSVMWNSVMWNSVMWNSVMWNSVMWNSVMWHSYTFSSMPIDSPAPSARH
jgi:serine protease AprX